VEMKVAKFLHSFCSKVVLISSQKEFCNQNANEANIGGKNSHQSFSGRSE
jgi:hypothetical protein